MRGREARMAAVVEDYNSGMTVKEIADRRDIAVGTVQEYLRQDKLNRTHDEERSLMISERTEEMAREHGEGMSIMEIAENNGVSYSTVQKSLQGFRMGGADPDLIYKYLTCPAQDGRYISRWARMQAGRTLRTPDGEMTVAEVYPNITLCIARRNKRTIRTTFTNGQLFYMNGGR